MVRHTLWLAALSGALLAATGCQDLIGLTPGTSGDTGGSTTGGSSGSTSTTGGSAGTTSAGGSTGGSTTGGSTTGGTGGTGGTAECPDCTSDLCQKATCIEGKCIHDYEPAGKVVSDPQPGDCKADLCDGNGTLLSGALQDDDADDGHECTWDACADGASGHLPKRDGTRCSEGLCEAGACLPAMCNGVMGKQDGTETDIDCGGGCGLCAIGKICQVAADCDSDFCSSGKCAERVALATTLVNIAGDTHVVLGSFGPLASPVWTVPAGAIFTSIGATAVTFDAAGEGLGVFRQATSGASPGGARVAHYTSAGWSTVDLWAMGGLAGNSGTAWFPSLAVTDDGVSLFAQNTNQQHLRASPTLAGGAFTPLLGVAGTFSGVGVARQGHASFFHASGISGLVETRHVGGAWSTPKTVLEGNYADAQPAAVALPSGGTLVVALSRQENGDHLFDWVVLPDKGPPVKGTIPGLVLLAPNPPPRKLTLSVRAGGGAFLAYRKADSGALDAWLADIDAQGALQTWKQGNGGPVGTAILGDPSAARGLPGHDVEVLCVITGGIVRHYRLSTNNQWSFLDNVVTGVPSNNVAVAIATP